MIALPQKEDLIVLRNALKDNFGSSGRLRNESFSNQNNPQY
jgi:hypothetical protein